MVLRIHFVTLFSLILLSMLGERVESLVSFAMNVRQKILWGVLADRIPHKISVPNLPMKDVLSTVSEELGSFDPDAYRKEITDLVYQRSLDRFSS